MSKKKKAKSEESKMNEVTLKTACHTGNYNLYSVDGHSLMCGGWTREAFYDNNTVVIDLTGNQEPLIVKTIYGHPLFQRFLTEYNGEPYFEWLSLPIKDYGLPIGFTLDSWKLLKQDIVEILKSGHDVLVACQGGHGRTGMVMSILGHLLYPKSKVWKEDPVATLRSLYCTHAVDTKAQHQYVHDKLGLKTQIPDALYTISKSYSTSANWKKCFCGKADWWTTNYGLCFDCKEKYGAILKAKAAEDGSDVHTLKITPCPCGNKDCKRIFISKCNHVVHDQQGSFGDICDKCFTEAADKKKTTPPAPVIHLGGTGGAFYNHDGG